MATAFPMPVPAPVTRATLFVDAMDSPAKPSRLGILLCTHARSASIQWDGAENNPRARVRGMSAGKRTMTVALRAVNIPDFGVPVAMPTIPPPPTAPLRHGL